ncbi:hypothetical protein K458DRAFT_212100 [Lentithecium fluviatile CBS 122367]|uniref:Uncharacterized protein n=1 Tax=Lentithecium fluviatile CBS 122367 TaxID=1168545 RepID=A0A6G1J891_9PLEO|nr:hypothetical protein K458DRAFT_212100 [Lentithecium fluviatile CBS 122367]
MRTMELSQAPTARASQSKRRGSTSRARPHRQSDYPLIADLMAHLPPKSPVDKSGDLVPHPKRKASMESTRASTPSPRQDEPRDSMSRAQSRDHFPKGQRQHHSDRARVSRPSSLSLMPPPPRPHRTDRSYNVSDQESTNRLPFHTSLPKNFDKPLTFFWYHMGACNKRDEDCAYAHYDTGYVAKAPVAIAGTTRLGTCWFFLGEINSVVLGDVVVAHCG